MQSVHDPSSGSLAAASAIRANVAAPATGPTPDDLAGGDVLSEVLRTVRLTGALFFVVDASTPWVAEVPDTRLFTDLLLPGAEHLISYHIITRGSCWGALGDGPPVRLAAGDVLVVPHGDPYGLSSAPGLRDDRGVAAAMSSSAAWPPASCRWW